MRISPTLGMLSNEKSFRTDQARRATTVNKEMLVIVLRIRLRTIFIIAGVILLLTVFFAALGFVGIQSSSVQTVESTPVAYVSP